MDDDNDISLPDGWVWTTIGEVTQSVRKLDPTTNPDKEFIYLDISSIDNTTQRVVEPKVYKGAEAPSRARQSVKSGDVLFSTVRTYLKNIAIVPAINGEQIASTGFAVLRANEVTTSRYLYYYALTEHLLNELSKLQRGTSYPAVRDSDVRSQKIPIAPLNEQHHIVAKIEELLTRLDAGVAALKRAQANLKRYKASVLKAACEGRLVSTEAELARAEGRSYEPASALLERILAERHAKWEADLRAKGKDPSKVKYVKPQSPDTSGLLVLPEGWCWASVEQILAEPLANGRSVTDAIDGFPVLRLTALRNGRILLTERKTGAWTSIDATQFLVKKGDFLIARGNGSMSLIGRGGLVEDDPDLVAYPDTMIRIRPLSMVINARFLRAIWDVNSVRQQIERQSRTSAGIYKINQSSLHSIVLPIPPISEQVRIVDAIEQKLSIASNLVTVIENTSVRLERLRQSILKRAFSGKLVSQDPNDEPASVLLEGIQAERSI